MLGYDHVVDIDNHHVDEVAPAALQLIAERPSEPFFLSIGFFETHREYFEPTSVRDALYSLPPANLPDTPETRRDMASYKASARSLDHGVGAVLNALDEHDLADDTIVILTTDHGLAFPGAKATLTDRGLGVMLIMRGPGGFHGGKVSEALVSQIDLFPTLCELAGIDRAGLAAGALAAAARAARGRRGQRRHLRRAHLPRRLRAPARHPHPALQVHPPLRRAAHAGAPERRRRPDQGPAARATAGRERELPREELHDLRLRPGGGRQRGRRPRLRGGARRARASGCDAWMRETDDPLLARRRRAAAGRRGHRPRRDLPRRHSPIAHR